MFDVSELQGAARSNAVLRQRVNRANRGRLARAGGSPLQLFENGIAYGAREMEAEQRARRLEDALRKYRERKQEGERK